MADDEKPKPRLEIAHVLFIDMVGYSTLLTDEQSEALQELNQIVRNTEAARHAEAAGDLTILPTGDGMALVFTGSVEEPAECALEISQALRAQPSLPVRMGIHSGPVHQVKDANERKNIAGVGINIAQRVMDCGDAGHILVSKRVADDLAQQRRWQPYLHDLGDVEVKHGVVVSLVNLYAETIGNPTPPSRVGKARHPITGSTAGTRHGLSPMARAIFIVAALLLVLAIVAVIFAPAILRSVGKGQVTSPSPVPAIPSPPSIGDAIKSELAKRVTDELKNALSAEKKTEGESSPAGPAIPEKSIAVLPFVDMSQAKDQEYFCDGISEEILDALAKVDGLRVVARTSSFSFKGKNLDVGEVAHKLNVENVLEGSLRREGNRIRVTAQLVNARDGFHIWSDTFEREVQGVFAVQDEITRAIVDALKVRLAVAPSARAQLNPESHDLYLKGRFYWNKRTIDTIKKSIDYFNQAIAKDPNYALAYAGLADCYSSLGFNFDAGLLAPAEAIPKAKAAALKALEIDDGLAEAHTSLAFIKLNYDWDWAGAEKEFKRAIELNPNYDNAHHWYSHYLTAMGRMQESLVESKRALELDPVGLVMNVHLGWYYFYARRYDEAIEQLRKTIEMDPNRGFSHWYLGMALDQKGDYSQAIAELQTAKQLLTAVVGVEADLGHAYAASGDREAAQRMIDELKQLSTRRYVPAYHIALIQAGLGEADEALNWLDKAYQERSDLLVYLKVEPRLDRIRSDPRFAALMKRVGFTEP